MAGLVMRQIKGFSLVEVLTSVCLLTLISTLSWPSSQAITERETLSAESQSLYAFLQHSQSLTQTLGKPMWLHFSHPASTWHTQWQLTLSDSEQAPVDELATIWGQFRSSQASGLELFHNYPYASIKFLARRGQPISGHLSLRVSGRESAIKTVLSMHSGRIRQCATELSDNYGLDWCG